MWDTPFNKVKILCDAMIGLEKSFPLIYSNTHLITRETLPLIWVGAVHEKNLAYIVASDTNETCGTDGT